jgi:hypothetical protein
MASVNLNPAVFRKLAIAFGSLLVILFIWRVLRIKAGALLLMAWFVVFVGYFIAPRAEPEPNEPRVTKATVQYMVTITTLGPETGRGSFALQHPYQIVELKFTPQGMDTPVIAVDKIDLNSIPNLQPNQTVDIVYDSKSPRVARLSGGTRLFPQQAVSTIVLTCAVLMALVLFVVVIRFIFRPFRRLNRAAKINALLQRRRRF